MAFPQQKFFFQNLWEIEGEPGKVTSADVLSNHEMPSLPYRDHQIRLSHALIGLTLRPKLNPKG